MFRKLIPALFLALLLTGCGKGVERIPLTPAQQQQRQQIHDANQQATDKGDIASSFRMRFLARKPEKSVLSDLGLDEDEDE